VLLLSAGSWHSTKRKRDVYGRDGGKSSVVAVVCCSGGRDPVTVRLLLNSDPNMGRREIMGWAEGGGGWYRVHHPFCFVLFFLVVSPFFLSFFVIFSFQVSCNGSPLEFLGNCLLIGFFHPLRFLVMVPSRVSCHPPPMHRDLYL